ncbi:MAG TPA: hypothetical protein VK427_03795, partial [Kofleriaceae bacterium]|nr:hypothetical protein [Kofleriaceae bacterium]
HERMLAHSERWTRARIDAWQAERLAALVAHAYANVPYYRRVMDERGLAPSDVRTPADLAKLPVLTKDIIRREGTALHARGVADKDRAKGSTGGSTGEPMQFLVDRSSRAWSQAAFRRGLGWAGLAWGEPVISLLGGSLGTAKLTTAQKIARLVTRNHVLPAFEVRADRAHAIAGELRQIEPKAIIGYTSSLFALARVLEEARADVQIPLVFTTAEILMPVHVEVLERVFRGRVFDYYGCGEINSIAYQCEHRDGYHVVDEKVILEAAPVDGRVERAIITDLSNYAFPFLRYENGDCFERAAAPCACGRGLSRLARVIGRVHDFIVATSGDLLAGEFFPHLFKWVKHVREYQIVQERLGEVRVRLVVEDGFNEGPDERFLVDKLHEYLGRDMQIFLERVPAIERTRMGKLRVTVSHLPQDLLRGTVRSSPP